MARIHTICLLEYKQFTLARIQSVVPMLEYNAEYKMVYLGQDTRCLDLARSLRPEYTMVYLGQYTRRFTLARKKDDLTLASIQDVLPWPVYMMS